jgi:CRP-like cAMP-binding protein
MIEKLLTKLRCYDSISAEEEAVLRSAAGRLVSFRRAQTIIRAKTELTVSTLLIGGLVQSFRTMADGRRQAVQFAVPGDFIDLHSFLMKSVDHDLVAMSDCEIVQFPHDRLAEISRSHDHLTRVLWLSTTVDGAIERETITSLGVRSAIGRLGHLFCELQLRLEAVGLAAPLVGNSCSYELALNQVELSEVLGLTPVHVNRMLKELRERELVSFRRHVVQIHDWPGLVALAEFDPFYLNQRKRPR